jgi:mono/diheme cytochrome c family protein
VLDSPEVSASAVESHELQPFFRYCATCHLTREQFPPSFLSGDASQIAQKLRQCAPRMLVRLSAWRTPVEQRIKSPMPPAMALQALGTTTQRWAASEELERLRAYVEALSRDEGQPSDVAELLKAGYEALPRCLPAPN